MKEGKHLLPDLLLARGVNHQAQSSAMKPLALLALFIGSFSSSQLCAQEVSTSHAAALERLFLAQEVQKQFEISIRAGFDAGIGVSEDQIKAMPAPQQEKFNAAMAKVKAHMLELLSWEKVKPDISQAYAKVFTEVEANEAAQMLESPTGKMLISKQLELLPIVSTLSQARMKSAIPEIMKMMTEEMQK
jgi:uncharacterized protein